LAGTKGKDISYYARSIFNMARAGGDLEKAEKDFGDLVKLVEENLELKKFLQDPTITIQKRLDSTLKILKDVKDQSVIGTISILAIFDKLDEIEDIYEEFKALVSDLKKKVYVEVLSAVDLDDATLGGIKRAVDRRTELDVRIKNIKDPSVVGGIIIKIGDRVIDLSLKGKLDDLKRRLKSIELRGEEFGPTN